MLKQRIITAVVLAAIIIGAIVVLPPIGLAGLFGLVVLLALWEWSRLSDLWAPAWRVIYCAVAVLLLLWMASFTGPT